MPATQQSMRHADAQAAVPPFIRVEALLDGRAAATPDRSALLDGERSWTFAAVRDESRRRAALLHAAGFAPGAVVVTTEPISGDVLISCLACCRLDVVFCHLSPTYTAQEVRKLVARTGARAALTADGAAHPWLPHLPTLPLALPGGEAAGASVLPARESVEAPAVLATTSGTTSALPKLAVVPHRAYTWRRGTPNWLEQQSGATCGTTQSFSSLLRQFCVTLAVGNAFQLARLQAPARFEDELARHGVALLALQPPILQALVRNPQPPRADLRLRVIRVGAAPLTIELAAAAAARYGVPIAQTYASTEAQTTIGTPPEIGPPGSVGVPYVGAEVRIVDPAGREVPTGETGELIVRSPGLMLGYLGDDAATADTIRDGWHWTGDLARRDAGGYIFLQGRRALQINVGGLKVTPEEVEATLLRHPRVREAAVLGMPDPQRGEVVRAVICADDPQPSVGELRRFCRQHLAPHKVPRAWEFRETLPRSPLGKVLRSKL